MTDNTNELLKAAKCVYLACDEAVADDISAKLQWAVSEIKRLDAELQKYRQAEAEGRLVVLPRKPNGAYWHRNYDTGQLELNFEMHSLREHDDTYPEYDKCAYWE